MEAWSIDVDAQDDMCAVAYGTVKRIGPFRLAWYTFRNGPPEILYVFSIVGTEVCITLRSL